MLDPRGWTTCVIPAALGVRSCPVSDPAADTERGSQVSVWVPLYGLVDGRQIAALTFVILPSGADRHQQVQNRLDHGPGRFERLPSLGPIPGPYFGHPSFTAVLRPKEARA